jgi:DNA-binding NarL/FixJ family response regulator
VIRVLIADDEALVRGGLRMNLEADIAIAAEADDGARRPRARSAQPSRCRAHGHSDAHAGRTRGHLAAPRHRSARAARAHPHHVRPRRVRLRGPARGRERLPPQERPPTRARRRRARAAVAGDTLLAPEITRRLVESYVRRPPPGRHVSPELESLTPRELEVFRHIACGRSNAEIPQLLYVTDETVNTHASRIFMKLGVRDRTQAVILAYEHGVIEPTARS